MVSLTFLSAIDIMIFPIYFYILVPCQIIYSYGLKR